MRWHFLNRNKRVSVFHVSSSRSTRAQLLKILPHYSSHPEMDLREKFPSLILYAHRGIPIFRASHCKPRPHLQMGEWAECWLPSTFQEKRICLYTPHTWIDRLIPLL